MIASGARARDDAGMRGPATPDRRHTVSGLAAIRAAWGTALLLAPDAVLRAVARERCDARTRRVTRVLGGRELVQGMVAARHRSRSSILAGAAVDATHAATMVALALSRPVYRRPATASALTAASFALAGLRKALRKP
jgi:hypothetical protein